MRSSVSKFILSIGAFLCFAEGAVLPDSASADLNASNGKYTDRIELAWENLPEIIFGSGAQLHSVQINVHRSLVFTGCDSLLISGLPATTLGIVDNQNITPGREYFYSLEVLQSDGSVDCTEIDSGYAKISPPTSVSATDGTFLDRVRVTWAPPAAGGLIEGYKLYRGQNCDGGQLGGLLPVSPRTYDDFAVVPVTTYNYSMRTVSQTGDSDCSAFDPGYPGAICSNGVDDDGDGYADYPNDPGCSGPEDNTETDNTHVCDDGLDNDGDGKIDFALDGSGDPGCESPTDGDEDDGDAFVSSPAFAKFNTYLGQWNFAELINQGTKNRVVGITVYNLRGQVMIQRGVEVPAGGQVDVDVNNLVLIACNILNQGCEGFQDLSTLGAPNGSNTPDGYVDTYGFVRFDWDDSNSNEKILGRVSFYRPNKEGSFSFAFAREFRNRTTGKSYGMSNTYDPKGGGDLTPNWVEVINFGARGANGQIEFTPQTYQVNLYNQDGVFKESRLVTLPALGEFDVHGGHEYLTASGQVIQGVYLVEVLPVNPKAEYFLSVARYSSNAPRGVDPETYNFALVLDGRAGTVDTLYSSAANVVENVPGLSVSPIVDNWIETACVDTLPCLVTAKFRNRSGVVLGAANSVIPAKGQYHFNASAVFPNKESGSVELVSSGPIIAQSMSYLHGSAGSLLSGFASIAKIKQRASQIGTINTFLGMENVLSLVSTTSSNHLASYVVRPYGGTPSFGSLDIGAGAASVLGISNTPGINFPVEAYGTFSIETSQEGVLLGEVRRVRLFNKEVDFVMPTTLR